MEHSDRNPDELEFEKELIPEQENEQKSLTSLQNEVDQLKIQLVEVENKLSRRDWKISDKRDT